MIYLCVQTTRANLVALQRKYARIVGSYGVSLGKRCDEDSKNNMHTYIRRVIDISLFDVWPVVAAEKPK